MLCRHRACPPKMARRLRHVCCRHLLLFCRHCARTENWGRRRRHVCCRHLLMLCRHCVCPKKCGAGIAMSAAGTCFCFAGIAFIWKNRAQAPYPVWGFKNLKEGRCRGEAVANATAVRIEGSIVCKTKFQTGRNCLHGRSQESSHL